jgi:hypothetical protein
MRVIDTPLAVLRFQYRIVRFPLQIVEERVVARMGSEAPARLFYERSLGLLDAAVGNALGDLGLAKRGGALAERSDALRRAAQLDAAANQARQQSSADLKAKSDKAIEDQQEARAARVRDVVEARTAAEERKRAAEESAAQRTAAAKKQADDVAARRKNSAEAAKRYEQARIRANSRRSPRPPSQSSARLRHGAPKPTSSVCRRTVSRSWPASRSRSANRSGANNT